MSTFASTARLAGVERFEAVAENLVCHVPTAPPWLHRLAVDARFAIRSCVGMTVELVEPPVSVGSGATLVVRPSEGAAELLLDATNVELVRVRGVLSGVLSPLKCCT